MTDVSTTRRKVTFTEHPFDAADGRLLTLVHATADGAEPSRGPVLLVHGAGVRADIFLAPVRETIVDALLDAGYDVWLENWRASIDLVACEWSLDDAAVLDHPAAVREVRNRTGADTVQAIIHCQGSTSFALAAVAGLLPDVTTIVSNAVSLHPVVPRFSRWKSDYAVPLIARLTPYFNPQWGRDEPGWRAAMFRSFVRLTHHECTNDVCRMVSFTYGTGFPALWSHDNISVETHEWLSHEFARVPLTFFLQMRECLRQGALTPTGRYDELPVDVVAGGPRTDARFALFAGEDNRCFLAESQQRTADWLASHRDGDSLHVVPGYGHLDMFMGDGAATDVFPLMIGELE
jgi:predicted alpha/beta hydrolase